MDYNWLECIKKIPKVKRQIITFEGMPASGKSTCVRFVKKIFPQFVFLNEQYSFVTSEDIRKFDELDSNSDGKDRKDLQFCYQELYFQAELRRREYIFDNTEPDSIVVLDRGVEDTVFATEALEELGFLSPANELRLKYYPEVVQIHSSLIILLDASLETLTARVQRRQVDTGVAEDRSDYYSLFYSRYLSWYRENTRKLHVIGTDGCSIDQVANESISIIEKFVWGVD